jgi:ribosomal protein S12 methylthiotransferase accessory factor
MGLSGRIVHDAGLMDPGLGPLLRSDLIRLGAPEPPWWLCTVALARTPLGTPFSTDPPVAGGSSIVREEAEHRGLGEALERYSALTTNIGGRLLAPRDVRPLIQFPRCAADEECPDSFRSFPLDAEVTYVPVWKLADGEQVLIPAGYVHVHFWPTSPEPVVTLPISTGLAFRQSLVDALWHGLCEVAERDALMITWWLRSSVREVTVQVADVADAPLALATRLSALGASGLVARFFDITTDFRVPTVFCLLFGPGYPHLTVGAACRADPMAAMCKSLDEAIAGRVYLRGRPSAGQRHDPANPPRRLEDHMLLYADGGDRAAYEFLTEGSEPLHLRDFLNGDWWSAPAGMDDLVALAKRLLRQGLTVFWADVTAPEVSNLGRVIKVVVPEMVPLSPDHSVRWLATPRLIATGRVRNVTMAAFNPYPHPLA